MARVKWGDDVPWKDLNDAEYSEGGDFEPYEGPTPPKGIVLRGDQKKVWLTESQKGDYMFKVLFVADGNEGDKKQYDGCPFWDNVLFTMPQVKFKWQPWLDANGISLRDIKAKTITGEEESRGDVVDKIGNAVFPAPARILTDVEKKGEYKGQPRVGKWLAAAEDDVKDDDYEDDDEETF